MTASRQIGLLWGLVALALLALSPLAPALAEAAPGCPLKSVAGVPCPTCGTTRTALALAQLDIAAALRLNPLATGVWVCLIAGGMVALVMTLAGRSLPALPNRLPMPVRLAVVAIVAVNWAYLLIAGT
jgi:hypothetical protein